MKKIRCVAEGIGVVLLASGCGDSELRSPAAATDAIAPSLSAPLTLEATPIAAIGSDDAAPGQALHRVVDGVLRPDGTIVIADETQALHYFDATGTSIRKVGREGDGPGEFRLIRSILRYQGDTLAIWDATQQRLTFIDADGNVGRSITLQRDSRIPQKSRHTPLDVIAVSDAFAVVNSAWTPPRRKRRLTRDSVYVTFIDPRGNSIGTIFQLPGLEWANSGGAAIVSHYGPRLYVGAAAGQLVTSDGITRTLNEFTSSGELRQVILPGDREGLSAAEWKASQERFLIDHIAERDRDHVRDLLQLSREMDSVPVVTGLRPDSRGLLWVQRFGQAAAPRKWAILDPSAGTVRETILPGGARFLDSNGDLVLLLTKDEWDRDVVSVHRITLTSREAASAGTAR